MKDLKTLAYDYAKALASINDLEHEVARLSRERSDIEGYVRDSSDNGWDAIALFITDHGFTQIMERFEKAIRMDCEAYDKLYNQNVSQSIITPSNFKSFIITILAQAYKNEDYNYEPQKGGQYRYSIEINSLSNDYNILEFIAIVRDNKVVTGYFNWVDANG